MNLNSLPVAHFSPPESPGISALLNLCINISDKSTVVARLKEIRPPCAIYLCHKGLESHFILILSHNIQAYTCILYVQTTHRTTLLSSRSRGSLRSITSC